MMSDLERAHGYNTVEPVNSSQPKDHSGVIGLLSAALCVACLCGFAFLTAEPTTSSYRVLSVLPSALRPGVRAQPARTTVARPLRAGARPVYTTVATDYPELRTELKNLVLENKCAAILLRLSWHDCGTYDKESKTGGAHACMRFSEGGESQHGANAGLDIAMKLVEPIKAKYPDMSHADFWALSAVVAIEAAGGPVIPFTAGRKDAKSHEESAPDGRLPGADQGPQHLRDIFYRMGFNDREIVALSGGHTIGKAHKDRSGFDGPWTEDPFKFDNSYFKDLVDKKWTEVTLDNGNMQYENKETGTMMLQTDVALMEDPEFKKVVEEYAKSEDAFFKDFSSAMVKLQGLGM